MAKRRSVVNRLLRAVAELGRQSREGHLPDSARWICDARLAYLRKPGTDTPRPIRVGEVWRRLVAKRLGADQGAHLQALFLRHRQGGVALPGGAEALIHLRRCLEQAAETSQAEALVLLDLDLRNAFPSLEWPAVREAVREHVPALLPWTTWCHASLAWVHLPCGKWLACDREAEQGDPLGAAYCALVLLRCAEAGRRAVEQAGG